MMTIPTLVTCPSYLLQQIDIITILIVTIVFFTVMLIFGVMKWIKLKYENDRLSKTGFSSEEDNRVYRDFREGHLYDNY